MSFDVAADAYDSFMGAWSGLLSPSFADLAGVAPGQRALDVGCGTGRLTRELVERLGADAVAAADPSEPFVGAMRERFPGVDVRHAPAEELPFDDDAFDAALAQLVVHFMADPVAGIAEMARVTRPGGVVAACMWDVAGGRMNMLRLFWTAMRGRLPSVGGEQDRAGTSKGDIAERLARAGLSDVSGGELAVSAAYADFDDFWEPFTFAVGPAGQALSELPPEDRAAVREDLRAELPDGPFELDAHAWYACGVVA